MTESLTSCFDGEEGGSVGVGVGASVAHLLICYSFRCAIQMSRARIPTKFAQNLSDAIVWCEV
jgi:hypothetical protein